MTELTAQIRARALTALEGLRRADADDEPDLADAHLATLRFLATTAGDHGLDIAELAPYRTAA